MASKKDLKRAVKQMVYDIMDECDYLVVTSEKGNDKAEKLMDDAVVFYEQIIPKLGAAKGKADFKVIKAEIEEKAVTFIETLNGIN